MSQEYSVRIAYQFSGSKLSSLPRVSFLKNATSPWAFKRFNKLQEKDTATLLVGCLLTQSPKPSVALGGNINLLISVMYKHYTRCFVHILLFNPHSNTLKWLLLGNWDTEMKQLAPNHIDEVGLTAKPHLQCCNCVSVERTSGTLTDRNLSEWKLCHLYINIQMSKLSAGIHLKGQ